MRVMKEIVSLNLMSFTIITQLLSGLSFHFIYGCMLSGKLLEHISLNFEYSPESGQKKASEIVDV